MELLVVLLFVGMQIGQLIPSLAISTPLPSSLGIGWKAGCIACLGKCIAMKVMKEQPTVNWWLSGGDKLILALPETLIEGEHYLYRDDQHNDELAMSILKFVGYTSCPAIVVVSDGSGQKVHCPRDRLFISQPETKSSINGAKDEPSKSEQLD